MKRKFHVRFLEEGERATALSYSAINFSKCSQMLTAHVCFFFAWFNFVKPHDALKIEVADGVRRWKQRTPAMAAKITDHIWTLEELFNVKPPPMDKK
jgi:hypothetical protein